MGGGPSHAGAAPRFARYSAHAPADQSSCGALARRGARRLSGRDCPLCRRRLRDLGADRVRPPTRSLVCGLRRRAGRGALVYNAAHTYVWPVALAAACLLTGSPSLPVEIALIWSAHIGVDRFLGYGLKYPTAFKDTHLGRV